jgi:hypothetical protein
MSRFRASARLCDQRHPVNRALTNAINLIFSFRC